VLTAVGWSCSGLQAPDEDQSDEESSEQFHGLLPQGDVQTGLFPYREKSMDCSPKVTFRPACFRIEKNLQMRNLASLLGELVGVWSTQGQHQHN
jgi:hypothetical protein